MVKISVNRYVSRRTTTIRKEVEISAQKLRKKALKNLEEIFRMAAKIAKGEIKHQRINGKMVHITLNQRRIWLRIAEQAAKTIEQIATNINEKEIKTQLKEIEMLLKETTTTHKTQPQET